MPPAENSSGMDSAIQVCVRARPLNPREKDEGFRVCVQYDEPTRQVVMMAVDKTSLFQLRGSTAKGYAFDRRYSPDDSSDKIYDECVANLVEGCFKGYNATVLAYGQTGSGKTHTMAGGIGILGVPEEGVTKRVIRHIFAIIEAQKQSFLPGDKVEVSACALELYNEDLKDLSLSREERNPVTLKLTERPGRDGRIVPEVQGIREFAFTDANTLLRFFSDCSESRSTSSTKMNDASSRSHAIFTITIKQTRVSVEEDQTKLRTMEVTSKFHLVDLAGSERVKRSGVTGKELKEATHINSGLLALGNVIVALSSEEAAQGRKHIPYRDSKLTRLLQDSIGGNSYTVLISCISPCECDFEETNNTLKYANRACKIKNTPLPNKYNFLEEDLLPMMPAGAGMGMVQLQALLTEHGVMKEARERREKEREEKAARRAEQLAALRNSQRKQPGFQRLRAAQYDELRRQLVSKEGSNLRHSTTISADVLTSFRQTGRERGLTTDELRNPYDRALLSARNRAQPSRPSTAGAALQLPKSARGPEEWAANDEEDAGAYAQEDDGEGGDVKFVKKGGFRRRAASGSAPSLAPAESAEEAALESVRSSLSQADLQGDIITDADLPLPLVRFKVNQHDTLAVFKACTKEDFVDVVQLLPQGTPLPASERMSYLLARLEVRQGGGGESDIRSALTRVALGEASMAEAVGPAVGCLMATVGTNMISTCIYDFEDPEDLEDLGVEQRIELWGLQIPHNSVRPMLDDDVVGAEDRPEREAEVITWTSVDRLNMSIGLLYALCNHALENGVACGFCVPRPQLLRRWLQAGARMKQITSPLKLIYPPNAHDYEYYRTSTVAYFMIDEVKASLERGLCLAEY